MPQKGFTLIELMVVILIMGLIIAFSMPNFLSFQKTLFLRQTRELLVQDLRYSRQIAVTRHVQVIMAFGAPPTTTNILTYTVHVDTDGDRVKDTSESHLTKTLPKGSKLSSVALTPVDSLIFDPSGALAPNSTGGSLIFVGAQNKPDTLLISGVGMVYNP